MSEFKVAFVADRREEWGLAHRLWRFSSAHGSFAWWRAYTLGLGLRELFQPQGQVWAFLLVGLASLLMLLWREQRAYDVRRAGEHSDIFARHARFGLALLESLGEGYQLGPHLRASHLEAMAAAASGLASGQLMQLLLGPPERDRIWGLILTYGGLFAAHTLGLVWLRRRTWRVGYQLIGEEGL